MLCRMGNDLPHSAVKTRAMLALEDELKEPLEVALRRLYYEDGLTLFEISQRWGLSSPSTVWGWLRKLGIPPAKRALQSPPAERVG